MDRWIVIPPFSFFPLCLLSLFLFKSHNLFESWLCLWSRRAETKNCNLFFSKLQPRLLHPACISSGSSPTFRFSGIWAPQLALFLSAPAEKTTLFFLGVIIYNRSLNVSTPSMELSFGILHFNTVKGSLMLQCCNKYYKFYQHRQVQRRSFSVPSLNSVWSFWFHFCFVFVRNDVIFQILLNRILPVRLVWLSDSCLHHDTFSRIHVWAANSLLLV